MRAYYELLENFELLTSQLCKYEISNAKMKKKCQERNFA